MDVSKVNELLQLDEPEEMSLQLFEHDRRELELVFTCRGGPREDQELSVRFDQPILFHLPNVLRVPVRFKVLTSAQAANLIPPASFDASEFCDVPGHYRVASLTDQHDEAYGFYVAALSVSAEWRPARGKG